MLQFGGGFVIVNRVVSAKELSMEVIQDLYPFMEYLAWNPKWQLQLKAEIRSQEMEMQATPPAVFL